jgi:hypothetical protein
MKKSNNIIIIGCSISSLYAAIRCIDIGYKVQIIERKNSIVPVYDTSYHNFSLYNDNHKLYINLLKRFNIKTETFPTEFNQKLASIIKNVLQKSKLIPQQILMTYTFKELYNSFLNNDDITELNAFDNTFGGLFEIINALDCINMFTYDIVLPNITQMHATRYYYVSMHSINELINNMISYIYSKNGKILYNNDVKSIKYIKRKFVIGTSNHNTFSSDMLITTISKTNLLAFSFWNNAQLTLLNTLHTINAYNIKNMLNTLISFKEHDSNSESIRNILLDNLHIVYPNYTIKDNNIYVCKYGVNSVILREQIRTMYNNKFIICSESFSKNNMFINYSLELVDNALNLNI